MESVRIGLSIRALRPRRGWTQAQLGSRGGCSASRISRIERGAVISITLKQLESVLAALGARLSVRVLWQGEDLDRLLDRDHAQMVESALSRLATRGRVAIPEVTFQIDRERGSIDILAWHPAAGILLVIEIKSVVPDVQAALSGMDRKARLAPQIARERGWEVRGGARLLILPDDRTARRRVEAFSTTFNRVLPARTAEVKRWLTLLPASWPEFYSSQICRGGNLVSEYPPRSAGPRTMVPSVLDIWATAAVDGTEYLTSVHRRQI